MNGQPATREITISSATVAEQLYHGRLATRAAPLLEAPRLLLDLDRCVEAACESCEALCGCFFHPENEGVRSLLELVGYQLLCRCCRHPHCVDACPKQALEQAADPDRFLVRHTSRCVGCQSCSHACPYGTILPDLLTRYAGNCDYCLSRSNGTVPPCVETCPHGALRALGEPIRGHENTYLVGDFLVVQSRHWRQEKA